MSREFKFRVWSFLDKSFHYFTLEEGIPPGIAGGISVPQQFTSLKDRNGKEIYEGDIVSFLYEASEHVVENEIGEVMFSEGIFYFGKSLFASNDVNFSVDSIVIIGNIFAKPCTPDHNGECLHCDEPTENCILN